MKQPLALKAGDVAFASNGQGKFGSQDVISALGDFYKDDVHTGAITGKVKVSQNCSPAPAPNPNPGESTAPGSSNSQFVKVLAGLGVAGAILAAIFGFLRHSNIPLPFRI